MSKLQSLNWSRLWTPQTYHNILSIISTKLRSIIFRPQVISMATWFRFSPTSNQNPQHPTTSRSTWTYHPYWSATPRGGWGVDGPDLESVIVRDVIPSCAWAVCVPQMDLERDTFNGHWCAPTTPTPTAGAAEGWAGPGATIQSSPPSLVSREISAENGDAQAAFGALRYATVRVD